MADKELLAKLAELPLARPGYGALNISAPVIVQMNPNGKWENCKPENLDEQRLKNVVRHLVDSNAVSAAQSYCYQCAIDSQKIGGSSNYVPIIMMPIYSADKCPFDTECEVRNPKSGSMPSKKANKTEKFKETEKDDENKKLKKRGFFMQRLTDFDLLSQW